MGMVAGRWWDTSSREGGRSPFWLTDFLLKPNAIYVFEFDSLVPVFGLDFDFDFIYIFDDE